MGIVDDKIKDLKAREAKLLKMGGEKAVAKHKEKGKLTARERLEPALRPGHLPGDRHVRQPPLQPTSAWKRWTSPPTASSPATAWSNGRAGLRLCPGLHRAGGTPGRDARQEDLQGHGPGHEGRGAVGRPQRLAAGPASRKGSTPWPATARSSSATRPPPASSRRSRPSWGRRAGGAVYSPAMTDFVFMVKNTSYMFITGPEVIKAVTGEEISFEDLGGAMTHNDEERRRPLRLRERRRLPSSRSRSCSPTCPSNNMEDPPVVDTGDDPRRTAPELDTIIPDNPNKAYDMKDVIRAHRGQRRVLRAPRSTSPRT